jgi:hypothetical protein
MFIDPVRQRHPFGGKPGTLGAVILACAILLTWAPVMAGDVSFQPRLEAGWMHYSFESEAINEHLLSLPIPLNSGSGITQSAFEYSDILPFIGAGGTFFLNRFFFDFSGQYSYDGKDTTPITYSAYFMDSIDFDTPYVNTTFMAMDTSHTARIDRRDMAVSLGYALTRRLSLFAGYKWAETQFNTTYQGVYSTVQYNSDSILDGNAAGRIWGDAKYRFEYSGPFVGVVQSWDCGHSGFFNGMLTANLALAHLEGKVVLEQRDQYLTLNSMDGQPVPEVIRHIGESGSVRIDTRGDAWGWTMGVGWRGRTALESLSYFLGLNGYRYEFGAEENNQSDINETAVIFKAGLAYIF